MGNNLPKERRSSLGAWALHICKSSDIANSKIARSVFYLVLSLSPPPNDLVIAQDMATELLKVMGSEGSTPLTKSETYPLINHSTKLVIASSMLQMIESFVVDMDWFTAKLKTYSAATRKGILLGQNGEQAPGLALEETLQSRAEAVVKVLSSFFLMNLKGKSD